jgi:serine/threonine protein kinase
MGELKIEINNISFTRKRDAS